jgi:hypothetical protein
MGQPSQNKAWSMVSTSTYFGFSILIHFSEIITFSSKVVKNEHFEMRVFSGNFQNFQKVERYFFLNPKLYILTKFERDRKK